ncbi:PfkB family carbohydrate kinase [Kineococcus glutinatus]|uniref:Carbohydrate kinase family protein n=1 Tax=Kineococcus glutinatus TaxID=1070872 RepID=A0ABP8VIA9_9ACTN
MHDPLAALRSPGDPPFDVHVRGTVFHDIVFTGLDHLPEPGTEVWTAGMGSCPGGIANMATAASRLGLRTSLAATFSTDAYGEESWRTLAEQEGVDLSASRRVAGWHSPVTVSLAYAGDRAMVTHGHPAPVPAGAGLHADGCGPAPRSRSCFVHLSAEPQPWVGTARAGGALVFADVGWDPSRQWSAEVLSGLAQCHAFLPNHVEAMHYTRADTPAAALARLGDLVPVVVVTRGAAGALAVDATTGETAEVPGLPVAALDATGAGDVFGAAFLVADLAGWPLADRLAFADLCAGLSVQQFGGSLSAPGWGDITDWWHQVRQRACGGPAGAADLARRYAFLDDVVPPAGAPAVRRATATLAARSDLPDPPPPPVRAHG